MKEINIIKIRLIYVLLFIVVMFFYSCEKKKSIELTDCDTDDTTELIPARNFHMGFSTWPYGPDEADKSETYAFISQNADFYAEQIDDKIPWNALIHNTALPEEFIREMDYKVSHRIQGHKLLLSVSLLNSDRNDLLQDYDGTIPAYTAMNEKVIEDAYVKHLDYLVGRFNPDYLVYAMEVNELKLKSQEKWAQYKLLAANIRSRIKSMYPDLELSQSVTLHNYFNPDVSNPAEFISEISSFINQTNDFASISFYPFFKELHSQGDFQVAFYFLHAHVTIPIAFVETTHLAEPLEINSINLNINSNVCEQKAYLRTLFINAHHQHYRFITWWAYRDFDELWETFPSEYRDLGKLWRDTGLLDENGDKRPAYNLWKSILAL